MRKTLALLLCLGSFAGAAQVTLREGETGRLGARHLTVLEVQDRRCGPTADCLADVVARVQVKQNGRASVLTLSWPPERVPRWSGVGVVAVSGGSALTVKLTNRPPGNRAPGQTLTLRRGETGQLGPRQVKLLGLETRVCSPQVLCVRSRVTTVYLDVRQGGQKSWLALEYPAPVAHSGVRLVKATDEARPALTFSDVGE
ncbi:hypothetical protein [Deinococcus radiodurans]|jgi:hypothetical protein|uniref:Uncharacterized protein n=1 Tax=Deinococcus radiodurans (strain ATCC 13939 / DSM 20539 / JCM 16871 / CCUG 27074 / LMG 4051 / NBRC 15346 / NCIMB 9279 / VKM B-1422 / R1) TaxID=243230 RepID=Q9RVZ9_DEIRA|nr:hypothetical protein [Deinococcus radiodurans]AAF10461.1 hypothetical protein DR_0871 [Deinococcus radiodurans R1 = ATCC 13939 = DSM 20539]ANC71923.1 hypothetical protein A2G07_09155 [Deinococcus radiodurans R1 = ATCC 13939 = DSM 20539]QEM70378.1 hypothetical protein DXG80_00425 [Deinococcus radiodurans]QIP28989.1 hypothetical protein HAV23_07280 [Deinococcus radiodurans]QIP32302.1 hypothetical protein HAV35_09510 [Deinococcus radiodurans]